MYVMRCPPAAVTVMLGLALAGTLHSGCTSEAGDAGPEVLVPDSGSLSRLTAEQYRNTVRDLFAPIELEHLVFPVELEAYGGFENNVALNSASPALVEAYHRAARTVAEAVRADLISVLDCAPEAEGCAREWLKQLSVRAWRRPLTADEAASLLTSYDRWQADYGVEVALELSIIYLLQSPDFIYFPRFGADTPTQGEDAIPLSQWELASRLAYFIWNSTPDAELLELASEGQLQEPELIAEQARRMLDDPRAVDMVVSFHRQNWDFDEIGSNPINVDYNGAAFEALGLFSEDDKEDFYFLEYVPQVRFESEAFIAQHLFHGDARLATLLTSRRTWVTPTVANMAYGQTIPAGASPVVWSGRVPQVGNSVFDELSAELYPIELDPMQRAGLFTMAGFLIAKAGPLQPAPVRRGVTILARLLCTELIPPGDVPPLVEAEDEEAKTNREKYAIHQQSEACASCHVSIDGLGLTFEHYDALGRWRDTDNGYPVDASGQLLSTDQDGPVGDAVELMHKLGSSRVVHDCYTKQWFRYAFGRNETGADLPVLEALQEEFWRSEGNVLDLVVDIAASYSFRHRSAP